MKNMKKLQESKNFLKSRVLWFNAVGIPLIWAMCSFLQTQQISRNTLIIVGLINIALRFLTTQPVTLK